MLMLSISLFFLGLLSKNNNLNWYKSIWVLLFLSFFFSLKFYSYMGVSKSEWGFLMDNISCLLTILSCWISGLMIMSSYKILKDKNYILSFIFNILMLNLFIILVFIQKNLFLLYIFFESSLIPTLMLILVWGYQPERLQAGMYMVIYTIIGALPFLLMSLLIFSYNGHLSMILVSKFPVFYSIGFLNIWWCFMILVFLIKLPIYGVHLWLPKAHVEAPVSGSMILAGLLLKLGGYGIVRLLQMFKSYFFFINEAFISLAIVGGVLSSLICVRQPDMKSLIAYSSIGHMGMMLAGVLSNTELGIKMGLLMMISHGLCSSGLFSMANMLYEKVGSRSLMYLKGFISFSPSFSMWFFLLCAANMAAPPSLNLMSEVGLITVTLFLSKIFIVPLALMTFFAAVYSMFLFVNTQHGYFSYFINPGMNFSLIQYMIIFFHWLPIQILIFIGFMI
uniref:NADH-ubiquinone oxidoreductase chain 4 n=1 Tax=Cyanoplax caverna TaxID=1503210 RepID=A0A0E3DE71_9MOLL|nr:NADH dehydrogenase subunit 4 [Cyanoplax caverna]AIA77057.1 NADH dehydrogenase subunit 4 [Cyanoplax caverna]